MELTATDTPVSQLAADSLVIGLFSDRELRGFSAQVNEASGGLLTRLIEAGELTGKRLQLVSLLLPPGLAARQLLVVGLGSREDFDRGTAFKATAAASRRLADRQRQSVGFYLADGWTDQQVEAAVTGLFVGSEGQDLYRAERRRFPPEKVHWAGGASGPFESGAILGRSVNLTRRLVNEPAQVIFPASFAERAVEAAESCGLQVEVWDEARLAQERAGAMLAVAKGSDRPPRLVILRHARGRTADPWLALVGKGVTFDSGGLSLKPTDSMKTMKCDMAGAATVLGAMQAIAQLELPCNVIGLVGLVENMTGGSAMKLGDVLHARNGRTIEVQNTDAEGRLVLADVLSVAVDQGAAKLIDLATLTGACVVALGNDVAGAMTNDQPWCDTVIAAARSCGEPCWQLPMYPEYKEQIESEVADIRNTGEGRWGGAITAAKFLEEFVDQRPWVHLDIAGPAFYDKPRAWQDGGGSGVFVRTLVEIVRGWK